MSVSARPDTRLTYQDFVRFPDDGKRHEIIDGVHHVTPSPSVPHQRIVHRLAFAIELHLRAHPNRGEVFVSPLDVVFSNTDIVEPDLVFVAADQSSIVTGANIQGAPALVVEVISRSTRKRDEHVKRRLFERCGVREYWLVDPDRRSLKIVRRGADGEFSLVAELRPEVGENLTTPLLPGFSLPLAELFAGP